MKLLHSWVRGVVAVASLGAVLATPVRAGDGLRPPPVGTNSVIKIDGTYGGSYGAKGQEPQKFSMPLGGTLELIGYGDEKSPRYVLLVADAGETPFLQGQALTFLKARGSELVEDAVFGSYNMTTMLLLPVVSPRGLADADLKAEPRDVAITTMFNPLATKIRCDVSLSEKADGLHVVRKLVRDEKKKPGDDKPKDDKPDAPARPAQVGPKQEIRAYSDEFVLEKGTGLLISGRTNYEIEMSFGEQSQVLTIELSAKVAERRKLSDDDAAMVADDAKQLQKLGTLPQVLTEELDKLKDALAKLNKSQVELDAFATERANSPLKAGIAAVQAQIAQAAAGIEGQVKEQEFLAQLRGKPAPDFTLKNLNDEDVTLSSFIEGKVALISFWGFG